MIKVSPKEEYKVSTILGNNACICFFDKYGDVVDLMKGEHKYKTYDITIPDGVRFMSVDIYNDKFGTMKEIKIQKNKTILISGKEILQRLDDIEDTFGELDSLLAGILA